MSNIVILTPEEHYLAHLLLVKINPNNYQLLSAATIMTANSWSTNRPNNKIYGWLRRALSNYIKENKLRVGSNNTQFGTMWITDGKNNKKIKINEAIPTGWRRGRFKPVLKRHQTNCIKCNNPTGTFRRKYCPPCLTIYQSERGKKCIEIVNNQKPYDGRKFITNEVVEYTIPESDPLPVGFRWGRLTRKSS